MAWCEDSRVDYLFGLAGNSRLTDAIEAELAWAAAEHQETGKPAQGLLLCHPRQLEPAATGDRQGRAPGRGRQPALHRHLAETQGDRCPDPLRTGLLCRGEMENRIKECQLDLGACPRAGEEAGPVGRSYLDRDDGRQPAAAVVLVVRLRAAVGAAPRRPARHRVGSTCGSIRSSSSNRARVTVSSGDQSPSPAPTPTSLSPPAARTALSLTADDGRRHRTETCARGDSPKSQPLHNTANTGSRLSAANTTTAKSSHTTPFRPQNQLHPAAGEKCGLVRPAKRAPEINVGGRMRDHGAAGTVAKFRDVVRRPSRECLRHRADVLNQKSVTPPHPLAPLASSPGGRGWGESPFGSGAPTCHSAWLLRRDDLPRIHDVLRIQCALQASHDFDLDAGLVAQQARPFQFADAVLG